MNVSSVVRARPWILALAVIALLGGVVALRSVRREPEVSETYCSSFADLDADLARITRLIEGTSTPSDGALDDYRGVAGIVYSDRVAKGGPSSTDDDAVAIARAIRAAIRTTSAAPLRAPEIERARDRMAPLAQAACEGVPH